MSEELDKLNKIGAQKIHEATHMPIQTVQAILRHDFDSFTKVQLSGFISILEREYEVDLSTLRDSANIYFSEKDSNKSDEGLFIAPKKSTNKKKLYSALVALVFIFVLIVKYAFSPQVSKDVEVDNRLIEDVKKTIQPQAIITIDSNSTHDENLTKNLETNSTKEEVKEEVKVEKRVATSFEIVSKSKVWFGYIDMEKNVKRDKSFKGKMNLDPTKKWLLLFGHGYIDMYIDGHIQRFNSRENVRFVYEDGELRTINRAEFKRLNRGRSW